MSRPKAIIDWGKVDKFLQAQCNGTDIAGILGIDPETLYDRCKLDNNIGFSEYSATKRAEGVELLKLKQYQIAMNGNVTMLIWLGKQYAGQRDKQEITQKGGFPILNIVVDSLETGKVLQELISKENNAP